MSENFSGEFRRSAGESGPTPKWRERRNSDKHGGWTGDRDDRPRRSFDGERGRKRWDRDDRGGKKWDGDDRPRRSFDGQRGGKRWDRDDRGGKKWDRDDRPRRSFDGERAGKRWDRDDRGGKKWDREDRPRRSFNGNRGSKRWDRDNRGAKRPDRGGRGGFKGGQGYRRDDRRSDTRPKLEREPGLPDKVNPKDLDPAVLEALSTLNPDNAERVAKHLVMVGSLLDIDAEAAYAHAQAAANRASRIAEVREAAALAAYACGKYTEALREVRTARRLSGSHLLRAVEADCERGLGKPDKALALIQETDTSEMDVAELAELAMVASGARADMEQYEAGLLIIEDFLADHAIDDDETLARLAGVRADRLMELGRQDEADEVLAEAPTIPEAVSIVDLEEVADADTTYVASDLHGSRKRLLETHDLIVCDLDGVCYRGSESIPHAAEALAEVRSAGVACAFVTNNSSRSPEAVVEKLASVSIAAAPDEVMTAGIDAVSILVDKLPPAAKVLVVGGDGLREAVEAQGFEVVTSADDKPAAVIQGYAPDVDWAALSEATYAIRAGALFVATNLDATLPTERGFAVGNGSLVACVHNATGQKPLAGGKPFPSIYRRVGEGREAKRPLCVGDRLDTDIRGAKAAGYRSLHILTGVSTAREVALADRDVRPDYIGLDLRALTEPHPGVVKNPTKEWTSGPSAGFRADHQGQMLRDGVALEDDEFLFDLPDYRAFVAAVWEARDNGTFVRLPETITVVEEYPSSVDDAEALLGLEEDNDSDE